jgi:hypothetical protein
MLLTWSPHRLSLKIRPFQPGKPQMNKVRTAVLSCLAILLFAGSASAIPLNSLYPCGYPFSDSHVKVVSYTMIIHFIPYQEGGITKMHVQLVRISVCGISPKRYSINSPVPKKKPPILHPIVHYPRGTYPSITQDYLEF